MSERETVHTITIVVFGDGSVQGDLDDANRAMARVSQPRSRDVHRYSSAFDRGPGIAAHAGERPERVACQMTPHPAVSGRGGR